MRLLVKMAPILLLLMAGMDSASAAQDPIAELEKKIEGRIGLVARDTGSGRELLHRANERFLLCSTFKMLLAAQILHLADLGKSSLTREIAYGPKDLPEYSPVTSSHLSDRKMNVGDLCAAAVRQSDNGAANLLLRLQGGPKGLTEYLRSLGDAVTHLDRLEPELNSPVAGQDLDSTTPRALAETLQALLMKDALKPSSRDLLKRWLLSNETGAHRLKAGLPKGWEIADKTGTGANGATNDIGILYPPGRAPIVIAAFIADSKRPRQELETALARIGKIVSEGFSDPTSDKRTSNRTSLHPPRKP